MVLPSTDFILDNLKAWFGFHCPVLFIPHTLARDSVVNIVIHYLLYGSGFEHRCRREICILRTPRDWLWGTPSAL